ncbi:F0F1 ATP synthase subunit delta [Candidatus Mycoplasma haematominutum]|uniref:ATP synthase subunit delta n=1 Tax=Candidatus Mycoplasma haematominutum 'Birmingham 1' TaxID=1116213 RepID=G8C3A3_9MOLU|nr:F0F1 ATP synthase subunit delta [Candidatus Mycoplasma haematominutum]CCE66801.1 ATP synthase, delta subunit [Candidatus Mycoplasma haematominutum 'Birmingham 1']
MAKGIEQSRERILKFSSALISCYSEKDDYSRLCEESESLLTFLRLYPAFSAFLESPSVNNQKKEKFTRELIRLFAFQQKYLPSTILLLIQFELINHLVLFLETLIDKLEYLLSLKYIKVHSSDNLSSDQKSKLEKTLIARFGENIKLDYVLSSEMIVGIKLEYDDAVMECSLSKKLSDIKKQFLR